MMNYRSDGDERDAPLADHQPNSSDARREYWFGDVYATLHSAAIYAETGMLQVEVRDIGGIRRAIEKLILNVRLAAAAAKKIEELEAAERAPRAAAPPEGKCAA